MTHLEPPRGLQKVIEPADARDFERLCAVLETLSGSTPSLIARIIPDRPRVILTADTEDELEAAKARILQEPGLSMCFDAHGVSYRGTVTWQVQVKHTHAVVRSAQFAGVTIVFDRLPRGSGFVFSSALPPTVPPDRRRGQSPRRGQIWRPRGRY